MFPFECRILSSTQLARALLRLLSAVGADPSKGAVKGASKQCSDRKGAVPDNEALRASQHVVRDHKDVFCDELSQGSPTDGGTGHAIPLEEGAKPPFRPTFRLSQRELKEVKSTIAELLDKGLIEPSNSPYGAPVLL